jgi:sigma-B regulation protein RsbU (phosphoserine phosphatase)
MGKFITCFHGVLQVETGLFRYANAGHNYPLLRRAGGQVERVTGASLVMGLDPACEYSEREVTLQSGDTLLLYSDGVTEAPAPSGEHFGETRLSEFLSENGQLGCADWINALAGRVRSWCGTAAFQDDFTVVLLRRC